MPNTITHQLIPGGAHTNSKGDDQFPSNAPRYLERGEGCWVWDKDAKPYIDWTMGLRTMLLGYGVREVLDPVIAQIYQGSNFGRPSYIETELAQALLNLIPNADMVKFAKNGSTVTTAAIKLARAYTARDYVALCKDQPFFSYDDWFIGTTPCNSGVPAAIAQLSLTFRYNDIQSLEKLFLAYPEQIAAVILEPATTEHPRGNFLYQVRQLCNQYQAVLIFDEMITGFRWHLSGAQTYYRVCPDLSTFGKGIANGFSLAALLGKKDIMALGGLYHDKPRVFLMSSTHGAENHALIAAQAVLRFLKEKNVIAHLWAIGEELIKKTTAVVNSLKLEAYFSMGGIPCSPYYLCRDQNAEVSAAFRTLFLQEMIKNGVIFNYISPSFSHSSEIVNKTVDAINRSLVVYKKALREGVDRYLEGAPIKSVFRAYN